MARPKLYLLGPGRYSYRVEFRFVDTAGTLVSSKTWELHREQHEEPRALLLQVNAKLADEKPKLEEVAPNFVVITTTVSSLQGELSTSIFAGFQPAAVERQVAAFPVTLSVLMTHDGLGFSLYKATPKEHE